MKFFSLISLFILLSLSRISAQADKENYQKAVDFFKQANLFKQKFDFKNAELNFSKAAKLFKENHYIGNYIQCRYSIADINIQTNKYKEAEIILNEIEALAKQKYGEENKFLMNIYLGQGLIKAYKGKTDSAIFFYDKAKELNDKFSKPNSFFKSNVCSALGNAYSDKGNYKKALEYYLKDLEIKKSYVGENHPMLAVTYNNIANVYQANGDSKSALEYVDKAINLSISAYGKNNPETAKYYSSKGSIYADNDEYELALEYFNTALSIDKSVYGNNHKSVADILINIGILYNKTGKTDKALISFKDAYDIQLRVLGANHPDIAGTCNNIGYILEQQGKKESALKFYQKAIDIDKSYYGENHPELAAFYNNIGNNYSHRKDYKNALTYLLKAASVIEENYGTKNISLVNIYANIGQIYVKKEDFHKALMYYQKSLSANIRAFNPAPNDYYLNPVLKNYTNVNKLLISLEGKAYAFRSLYKKDSLYNFINAAYKDYILCDSVINEARKTVIKKEDKIILGNNARKIYEQAVITSMELSYVTTDVREKMKYEEQAFIFAEKNKATVLSEAVSAADVSSFFGIPKDVLSKEKHYKIEIAAYEKSVALAVSKDDIERLNEKLSDLNNELRAFNNQMEKDYPKYFESKYKSKQFSIKDIQRNLDDESAVRSYFIGEDYILIFTITKNNLYIAFSEKPDNLYNQIKEFNVDITSGYASAFSKYLKSAYDLYKLLFPDKISDKIKKITIIPDGVINLIPFEALITDEYKGDINDFADYPFLINKFEINYFYSAGLYLKSFSAENQSNKTEGWLGIAPVFGNTGSIVIGDVSVTPLPGSEREVNLIDSLFTEESIPAKEVLKNNATESFIKHTNLKKYKYIHIATHGIVNIAEPKLSALIFYPEKGKNDGILYSGEIYNLELNADLVVLSACETGIGKISKSEGVIGLSRALLYAGAKNIIVSLWKVSDVSTTELMVDFYKNLIINKENKTEALYQAKKKMIEKGGNYAHPFFWSPFVLIGN
ncbi:MAG: CHAT domain-containing protein [Chlorobi bacterium]|nr:CHAT domain-containing protein [Chlorobiota bacterium]